MKQIIRRNRTIFVKEILIKDLIINVKCHVDGTLDLRGKNEEYRIIVEDNLQSNVKY